MEPLLRNETLDMVPKGKKNWINWASSKLRIFFLCEKTVLRERKEPVKDCKEIFANPISNKGLITRIHKELLKFNNKTASNPIKKCTES